MGDMKEYRDGAGLTSQGRSNLSDRIFAPWPDLRTNIEEVADWRLGGTDGVDRWAFRLAAGNLTELFPQKAIEDCRFVMAGLLKQKGVSIKGDPLEIAPGQPFLLKLIGGFLSAANDPEKDLPHDFARGVTAGILHPMPRSPVVYEEQRRWRLEQDPLAAHVHYAGNYASVAEHSDCMGEGPRGGGGVRRTHDQALDVCTSTLSGLSGSPARPSGGNATSPPSSGSATTSSATPTRWTSFSTATTWRR